MSPRITRSEVLIFGSIGLGRTLGIAVKQLTRGDFQGGLLRSTQFQAFRFQTPTIPKRGAAKSGRNDEGH